jgi:NADPH:quinone reductase-like Zn-dependent oxidoreductase
MKAVWFREFGGPEVLVYEDAPDPEPEPGEALVQIRSTGINHVDLDVRAGVSRFPVSFPHILGLEYAGEVAAIRQQTSPFKEGDRVWVSGRIACDACEYCLTGRDNMCHVGGPHGPRAPGGYCELVSVPVSCLRALPNHATFEDAAAAQVAFGTAWHVLITRAALRAGDTVLIQAAGSGIGSAAVQVAHVAGATVIATASTDEKLRLARDLGADYTINYSQEEFAAKVMEFTRGSGVDVVMEHVGGEVFTNSLECLKRDGVIVTVGGHSGEVVPFDIIPFFRNEYRLVGSASWTRHELTKVMDMVFDGTFRPVIHQALPLSQAAEAHRLVDSRDFFGKVLLNP